jgi:hypothetical protein
MPKYLAVFAVVMLAGCKDAAGPSDQPPPPPPPPPPFGISGTWNFRFNTTAANGVCSQDVGEVSNNTITITQATAGPPHAVTARGFLGVNSNQLTGAIAGSAVTLGGSYPEDGGTTTAGYTLTWDGDDQMVGTELWSWTGAGGDCPDGASSILATRQ